MCSSSSRTQQSELSELRSHVRTFCIAEGTEDGSSDEAKNLVFGLPLSKVLKNERVRRGVRRAETLCAPGHSRQTSGGSAASGGSGDADGLESQSDAHLKSSSVGSDEAPDEARLAAGERKQKLSTASASDFSTSASSECVFMPPAGPMANFRKNASSISLSVGVGGGSGGTEIGCAHFAMRRCIGTHTKRAGRPLNAPTARGL